MNYQLHFSSMEIFYVLRYNKRDKAKKATIYFRIKLQNEKITTLFSTGIKVMPEAWDSDKKQVIGKYAQAENDTLALISYNLKTIFNSLMLLRKPFKAQNVIDEFFGKTHKQISLLEMYELFLKTESKTKKAKGTLQSYKYKKNLMERYLTEKKISVSVMDITIDWAESFREWVTKIGDINYAAKNFELLKRVLKLAVKEKYLPQNPLQVHSAPRIKKDTPPDFLTNEEIQKIMTTSFAHKGLQECADLFIFQCFTGLCFADLRNFCIKKHTILENLIVWIVLERKKGEGRTDASYDTTELPLFPEAKKILDKYDNELPKIRNDHYNSILKQIAQIVGIEKRLYTHLARKTAGDRWLNAGLSYEVVAKMLGHKSIETTRKYYARVRRMRVAEEIKRIM